MEWLQNSLGQSVIVRYSAGNLTLSLTAVGRLLPVDPLRAGRSMGFGSGNLADGAQLTMTALSSCT
jgi:hypothetical protein